LNGHRLTPSTVRIRVGDTVSFIIAGFHNLLVYGPGTQPDDIDKTNLVPGSVPLLINDPNHRLYRGLDPRALPGFPPAPPPLFNNQDRVEVVGFNTAGKYLVICGVLPHFFDAATNSFVMFGFVDVRERD
jgi:plastocyanin